MQSIFYPTSGKTRIHFQHTTSNTDVYVDMFFWAINSTPRPPQTYLSGKKIEPQKRGGEMIRMHNIYPCVFLQHGKPRLCSAWPRGSRSSRQSTSGIFSPPSKPSKGLLLSIFEGIHYVKYVFGAGGGMWMAAVDKNKK